jgi:hypothetical protein
MGVRGDPVNAAHVFFLPVVGLLVCFGAFLLAVVVFAGLLIFIARQGVGVGASQLQTIIANWAEEHDYELLDVSEVRSRDHPFADRFGFGFGKAPAVVRRVKVRTRKGRVRRGWVYVRARMPVGGFGGGFRPETLEVAWED